MRRLVAVAAVLALAIPTAGCTNGSGDAASTPTKRPTTSTTVPSPETGGLVDGKAWKARQADYLAFATSQPTDGGDPLSLLARAETDRRAGRRADLRAATVAKLQPIFDKLKAYTDTGDFDINELLTLWLRNHRDLDPEVSDAIRTRILAFKYWWTEPTPKGIVDSQYYWTENHQIIFLANEYIAGQTFPDRTFTNSDMTGRDHVAHAKERLAKWFEWRSRYGFSEWLSNVYWTEDMKGLLLLAEFARDPAMAREASMMLDLLTVELASHVERGVFGATHGRSYQKDKLAGIDEDTFSIAKLLFDQTPIPYAKADNATLLATARRYRPPEVARRIAASTDTAVIRQRAGIPLDPAAPIEPSAKAPYGLPFTGEDGLMIWWGMGGQFPWQVAPLSVETVKRYDLFETSNFQKAAALEPVVATADTSTIQDLARSLAKQVNPGLLSQVDTYTWRSPGVMLSTAQDWRPGQRGEQDHIWQATLDPDALVFTQHPSAGVPSAADPNAREGYWTGDGAMPRSAQWNNVNVSIYAPQYDGGGSGEGAYAFTYQPYTHAYFPTEKFDEVVQRNGWTLGRKGDGYVALWSKRPTTWRRYDPKTEFTHGLTKPFDLIAPGGPDNVWLTEVANASDYAKAGSSDKARFAAFVAAITKAKVTVRPANCPTGARCPAPTAGTGAYVSYRSPSLGPITFGWNPGATKEAPVPFSVDGKAVDLHPETFRWDSPWARADWDSRIYRAQADGATLDLDFTTTTRRSTRTR